MATRKVAISLYKSTEYREQITENREQSTDNRVQMTEYR